MIVQNQEQADTLNATGEFGPYRSANWHRMIAPVYFPIDEHGDERDYRIGDRIRIMSHAAYCARDCHHDSPPEDW